MRAFTEGFHDVIGIDVIGIFDEEELELILGGNPNIDIEDWRANTVYSGEYNEKNNVIVWFWEILEKMN